jgi:hypothetical protein
MLNDKYATISNVWQRIFDLNSKNSEQEKEELIKRGKYLNHTSVRAQSPGEVQEFCDGVLKLYTDVYRPILKKGFRSIDEELKGKVEIVQAIGFLHVTGLYEPYLEFCRKHQVSTDFGAARAFYNTWNVHHLLKRFDCIPSDEPFRALEIGAGAGVLAYYLSKLIPRTEFIIVDLPQMLEFSEFNLRLLLPEAEIVRGWKETVSSDVSFRMLTPSQFEEVPADFLNCTMNFNSFMEMDRSTIEYYFEHIYRTSKTGALHYNVNRVQSKLVESSGAKFNNNPLLYPYRADDQVVMWDTDPFQIFTRFKYGGMTRSQAYTRAALVKAASSAEHLPVSQFHLL